MSDEVAGAFEPDVTLWDGWSPAEVASRLERVDAPWYVAAGWALDLFQGRQTRDHDDLEIGAPAYAYEAIRERLDALGLELLVVGGGIAQPATEDALAAYHQTWARDRETGSWRIDVLREPWEGDVWVCAGAIHGYVFPQRASLLERATGFHTRNPRSSSSSRRNPPARRTKRTSRAPAASRCRPPSLARGCLTLLHTKRPWLVALAAR